jgi:hypothetical protein
MSGQLQQQLHRPLGDQRRGERSRGKIKGKFQRGERGEKSDGTARKYNI